MTFKVFHDPQGMLENLQDEMNRVFERVWHGGVTAGPFNGQSWAPMIDLYEYADRYTIYVELSGVDPKAVDVTRVGNTVSIRGERLNPADNTGYDRAVRKERRFGSFARSVDIPNDVDAEGLSAKCQDGVLEITVPKLQSSMPKSVKVEVASE